MFALSTILSSNGAFAKGATFDGSDDELHLTSGGGVITTANLLISLWFRTSASGANQRIIYSDNGGSGTHGIYVNMASNGAISIVGDNASGVTKLSRTTNTTGYNDGEWHHLLATFSGSTNTDRLYIDNASVATSGIVASDQVSWQNLVVGYNSDTDDEFFDGSLAEIIISSNSSGIDISQAATREKFIKSNKPANVGADGSTALGVAADYYFSRRTAEHPQLFGTNRGTGGTYAIGGGSGALIDGHWKWNGPTSGTVADKFPPALDTYDSVYHDRLPDGSITFTAPVSGTPTSGSSYTRSEYREINDAENNEYEWTLGNGGRLECQLAVEEMPVLTVGSENKTVVGQIHGPDDELCRLYYMYDSGSGYLYFVDDMVGASAGGSGGTETDYILEDSGGNPCDIPLGAYFTYVIEADSTGCKVTATYNGTKYSAMTPAGSFWPGKDLYFKCGTYNGVGSTTSGKANRGTGQSSVNFVYISDQVHPHTITSTSGDQTFFGSGSLTDPAVPVRVGN